MQALTKKSFSAASLREYPNARSVLERMAQDADRARRIKDLKEARPDLTWPKIAEAVGVKERSVLSWAAKGGVGYDNCIKLAGVFEVDPDWLWRGVGVAKRVATLETVDQEQFLELKAEIASVSGKLDDLLSLLAGSRLEAELEADDEPDEPSADSSDEDAEDQPEGGLGS